HRLSLDSVDLARLLHSVPTRRSSDLKKEMNLFLTGSLILSVITLFLFFRSLSATVMSLLVVGMGVIWSLGTMVLFGYKITLLTRSEEHTSELQSLRHLVCRLLLENND